MKTKDDVIANSFALTREINTARGKARHTKAQDVALKLAHHIASISQTIVLLTDSGAVAEAHTVGRLLLEHFFNLCALLNSEKHYDVLLQHSIGEPGRQLKKIIQEQDQNKTLTPENLERATEYLRHPERELDPKTGLNWEQIAKSGGVECLYTAYKQYSFLYAHSTLTALLRSASRQDIEKLHEDVWTALELARVLLTAKLIK